ncbi:MAG: PEP-CTERM sorting domain-containing protein [Phycisphaeraceae bacterium]
MPARRSLSDFFRPSFALGAALVVGSPALGDDLAPPPWDRLGAPNYTTAAEWEFLAPITFPDTTTVADGSEVPLIAGDGFGFPADPDVLPDFDIAWVPYDGDGGYLGGANGIGDGTLNFRVPNWIDEEPLKIIRVQITYAPAPTGGSPFIDEIIPFDSTAPIDSIANVGVFDGPIAGDPAGRHHRLEIWEIEPNPDFESIRVVVPAGVLVDQVVIDTISTVPEPASLSLLALGALSARRHRRE